MILLPVTQPNTDPPVVVMVATPVLLLVHVPPGMLLLSETLVPAQTLEGPEIAACGFTVTVVVA